MTRNVDLPPSDGLELEDPYIPNLPGNRDDPDPFFVHLVPMNAVQYQEVRNAATRARVAEMANDGVAGDLGWDMIKRLFLGNVGRVGGYVGRAPDGSTVRPTKGAELWAILERADEDERELVSADILKALRSVSHLKRGLKANLKSVSASP